MKAQVLHAAGDALRLEDRPDPRPAAGQILCEVLACGVCRTDLHIVDGELGGARLPLVPGHEVVARVVERGPGANRFAVGRRVGVPWLGRSCGSCGQCRAGRENLCDAPEFTGYTRDGGYAGLCVADEAFCFAIPDGFGDVEAAPLLCAGLIGWRTLRLAGDAQRIGLYGFGAAAHLLAQVAHHQGREVLAFTRPGDRDAQDFARRLGCRWAGGSDEAPPDELDAALIFAPVGALVPEALRRVRKGGVVVCGGIHMSEIPAFPYEVLWGERVLRSVANLERRDGEEFLALAVEAGIRPEVEAFPLAEAGEALGRLRDGRLRGAAVLVP